QLALCLPEDIVPGKMPQQDVNRDHEILDAEFLQSVAIVKDGIVLEDRVENLQVTQQSFRLRCVLVREVPYAVGILCVFDQVSNLLITRFSRTVSYLNEQQPREQGKVLHP